MPKTEANNAYVAMREAKIARNEARLAQLGLLRPSPPPNPSKSAQKKSAKKRVATKPVQEPSRRSRRLSQQLDQPNYKEVSLPNEVSRKRSRTKANDAELAYETPVSTPAIVRQPSTPAVNSVRFIDIDVAKIIVGENGLLGKMMEQSGKEHVINEAFKLASSAEDHQRLSGTRLSFNKYCGVQEWNNAIFLWVNLGSKDNAVVNDFLDGGKRITWFGGSRMHDDSPVIRKLLQLGKAAKNNTSNIVLWVRRYDASSKKFSPYICLGRLQYHSHQAGSDPLAFIWSLIDSDLLNSHSDPAVIELFQSLVQS